MEDVGVVAAALAAFLAITIVLSRRRNLAGTASGLLFTYGVLATFLTAFVLLTFHVHRMALPGFGGGPLGQFDLHVHSLHETLTGSSMLVVVAGAVVGAAAVFGAGFALNQFAFRRLRERAASSCDAGETARAKPLAAAGTEILVTRDGAPKAYCFALLERARGLWPFRAREVLVFSDTLTRAMDADMLEAVVAHESAHVHTRDSRHLPVVRAVGTLFFFDPFFRTLERRLEDAREFEADRAAAERTGNPLALARALLTALDLEAGGQAGSRAAKGGQGCAFISTSEPNVIIARIERLIEMARRLRG